MRITGIGYMPKARVVVNQQKNKQQSSPIQYQNFSANTSSAHEYQRGNNVINFDFRLNNFKLGENFEEITQTNIGKVLPLYKGYQEGMNQKVDEEKLRDFISEELRSGAQIFTIKEEDKNVGFVHFSTTRSTIDMCPFFTIQSVYVDHSQRGKGLAKQLVNKVKEYSVAKNYKGVFVKTHAKNDSSMNMYKNLDFKNETGKYGVFFWANEEVLDYSKGYVNTNK